jgi:hypothetical protein
MPSNKTSDAASRAATPDVDFELASAVADADSIVPDRIQQLQWIHQARAAHLARTAADLKARYGANDSGVRAAEAAVAAAHAVSTRLVIVRQQIATPEPAVPANGWVLYGVICDATGKPVPRLTVYLVDETKGYQSDYGYVYTDDLGRYSLVHEEAQNAGGEAAASKRQGETALFVEVSDLKQRTVYSSDAPAQLVTGAATRFDITISAGDAAVGEPPAGAAKGPRPRKKPKGKHG